MVCDQPRTKLFFRVVSEIFKHHFYESTLIWSCCLEPRVLCNLFAPDLRRTTHLSKRLKIFRTQQLGAADVTPKSHVSTLHDVARRDLFRVKSCQRSGIECCREVSTAVTFSPHGWGRSKTRCLFRLRK